VPLLTEPVPFADVPHQSSRSEHLINAAGESFEQILAWSIAEELRCRIIVSVPTHGASADVNPDADTGMSRIEARIHARS
jgi:hypothetical protein